MKCENCGTEIAEGNLYCEKCGNEIQIVPDFEPEVELTIDQTMNHILKDVFHHEAKKHEKPVSDQEYDRSRKHFYGWIVLLLGVSGGILLLVFWYMNFTADYQMRRGHYFLKQQDYISAIKHYEKADKLDAEDAEIDLYLAECYEALDKKAGYEASLTQVVQNEYATPSQLSLAYMRLASLYLEKEEYQKINSLLKNCQDEDILNIFGRYCVQNPTFSHKEGEYTELIPLKILGGEKGKIYYTLDSSEPTALSPEYSGPIFLNKGEYTIKAIYINEYGVISDVITAKFVIKL